jgi:glycosyltransferase involved in cell wall biosynthesis
MLLPRHPDLHLALLGEGSTDDAVRMHAAALGVSRHVSFLGERDDELAVLRAAELTWIVADGERAAFAALDGMALAMPVLIDRGTVAERYVADGITGAVLPPGETPIAAATIAELLGAEDHRVAMGAAGRARVAREYAESAMLLALRQAAESARDRRRWVH